MASFLPLTYDLITKVNTTYIQLWSHMATQGLGGTCVADIKTHGSELRGQEEAGLRDEPVSYLQVAPL